MKKRIKRVRETKVKYVHKKYNNNFTKKDNVQIINKSDKEYNQNKICEKKDCFKLVVVKKLPWYRKVLKTIGSLFTRFA